MKNKLIDVAFMYDFDETLSTKYMQEYSLFPKFKVSADNFWNFSNDLSEKHNMDRNLAYMYAILYYAKISNMQIKREHLKDLGKDIEFFDGVEEFFKKMNDYAKSIGINLKHYIISSGTQEIIEGTKIAHEFEKVFASTFAYDENGNAFWPAQSVNFTTKTQYIFRIKKNQLDKLYESKELNKYVADKSTLLPYNRMVYFGDGFTDIPSMKVVKDKGGISVCVYVPEKEKSVKDANKLYED